jgi:hypothetical protein
MLNLFQHLSGGLRRGFHAIATVKFALTDVTVLSDKWTLKQVQGDGIF